MNIKYKKALNILIKTMKDFSRLWILMERWVFLTDFMIKKPR